MACVPSAKQFYLNRHIFSFQGSYNSLYSTTEVQANLCHLRLVWSNYWYSYVNYDWKSEDDVLQRIFLYKMFSNTTNNLYIAHIVYFIVYLICCKA